MKICITGGMGHIGSYLIFENSAKLKSLRHSITVVDNLSTQRYCSAFNLPRGSIDLIINDVRDCDSSFFKNFDLVIHLAAMTDATSSFKFEREIEENNLLSTKHVAACCVQQNVPMVFASSTSVYGPNTDTLSECDSLTLNPQSPYAKVKLEEEKYLMDLASSDGLQCLILRLGTIHGVSPGIRFHTAVNKFCWQASIGTPVTVWRTALNQKRPYLSLSDFSRLIDFILTKSLPMNGSIFNVVTEHSSPAEIIEAINAITGEDVQVDLVDADIMNQHSYVVSTSKLEGYGFTFSGSLAQDISDTLTILDGLR